MEKQSLHHDIRGMLKEAQIMQALTHTNIPSIIGVQLQRKPISLIIEFKGEQNTSVTISKLLFSKEIKQCNLAECTSIVDKKRLVDNFT